MFSPSNDVSRRFRVIPLGGETEPNESAACISGDIQIEEVSRRRAAWAGHVERFLAALPGALRALSNGIPSSSSSFTSTRNHPCGDRINIGRKPAGTGDENPDGGFATTPTLFILDVRILSLFGLCIYRALTS